MDYPEMEARLRAARVIPVVTFGTEDQGRETVDRLVEAGAGLVEIVLRSPMAMKVFAETRARHPHIALAAGTVLDAALYDAAVTIGAILRSARDSTRRSPSTRGRGHPLVPGAVTASEVMNANRLGYTVLKFYPAEPITAPDILADYANVFPRLSSCRRGRFRRRAAHLRLSAQCALCRGELDFCRWCAPAHGRGDGQVAGRGHRDVRSCALGAAIKNRAGEREFTALTN